jgi:hypothetical protein
MCAATTGAAASWTGEFLLGAAVNADRRLEITQSGQPEIECDAQWATRPFEQPLYWSLRLGREGRRHGWAVELLHHKIYLENGPPEVQSFSISHGLNYLSAQHGWIHSRWRLVVMLGVAVAHRENTIRGQRLEESGGLFGGGYELTGPVLGAGLGAVLPLFGVVDLSLELRVAQSWIKVDVVDGRASTSNLALHLLVGPRLHFGARGE